MPGPAVAAIGATLGSAAIGAAASNRAAKAQSRAADQSAALSREQFNRLDQLQGEMFTGQTRDIDAAHRRNQYFATQGADEQRGIANALRQGGLAQAESAYDKNTALNRQAQSAGLDAIQGALQGNRGSIATAYTRGMGQAGDARDAQLRAAAEALGRSDRVAQRTLDDQRGIADATQRRQDTAALNARMENQKRLEGEMEGGTARRAQARGQNLSDLQAEQNASLKYFEPNIGLGNNALAAYGYNLGLGNKPAGYTGLEMTPGAQFAMSEARTALEGGAAARGGLYSGAAMEELQRKSQGIAAQDRDVQMAQLMGLGQVGQGAANSAADVRSNYSGRMANERTGAANDINALRSGYTGALATDRNLYADRIADNAGAAGNMRAGAASDYANRATAAGNLASQQRAAAYGDYADRAGGLGTQQLNASISARDSAVAGSNALRNYYTGQQQGVNNARLTNMYGMNTDFANAMTNASDTETARLIAMLNDRTANMGAARSNRANLLGSASANYVNSASAALQNKGDARAAGAIGMGNSILGGINNGLGVYGMMGGQFGGGARTPTVPANGTDVFAPRFSLSGLF